MSSFRGLRSSPAVVIASLALLVALAGTGYAAVTLPADSVGTAQLKNGAVTAAKVKRGTLLKSNFAANQLPRGARGPVGSVGSPGPPGAPGVAGGRGPTGPAGTAATSLWAVVNPDGSLARGSGAAGATHVQTGVFRVRFNRTITQCGWIATIGSAGSTTKYGLIEAELASGTTDSVQVGVRDKSAVPADYGFIVSVLC